MQTTYYLSIDRNNKEVNYEYEVNYCTEFDHFYRVEYELTKRLVSTNADKKTREQANKYMNENIHLHYDDIIDVCDFHYTTE